ncbi:MAG: hypothetical protein ACR2ID_04215 [Chthoniobacterales bacterium]
MKRSCSVFLALVALFAPLGMHAEESDREVQARNVALDLAGAFSNDGFKIRDGHWSGPIKQGERALIAVNLYAGNQYWFSVGADQEVKKFSVQVYDEHGNPVPTEEYVAEDKAAAGYSPTISGQYYVSVAPTEGEANAFCLVYSYK